MCSTDYAALVEKEWRAATGHADRVCRAWASHAGDQEFNPRRVKPMTYQMDTCRFLARRSVLIG